MGMATWSIDLLTWDESGVDSFRPRSFRTRAKRSTRLGSISSSRRSSPWVVRFVDNTQYVLRGTRPNGPWVVAAYESTESAPSRDRFLALWLQVIDLQHGI